jgi:hypothetical protein
MMKLFLLDDDIILDDDPPPSHTNYFSTFALFFYCRTLRPNQYLLNRNVYQLNEESNKPHGKESDSSSPDDGKKLLLVRPLAVVHEVSTGVVELLDIVEVLLELNGGGHDVLVVVGRNWLILGGREGRGGEVSV